jgi:hypothetical protein
LNQDQELKQRALALYTPPFRVMEGAIYDANGHMVADDREGVARVRGWGRLGYMQEGAALQDMVGELLVAALNDYWNAQAGGAAQAAAVDPATPAASAGLPHPACDEACHYHCTENGSCAPKCVAVAAAKERAAQEAQQVAQDADGLPPPDYYVSSQHGTLLIAEGGTEPRDPAYRWRPVWGAPVYEQNAAVRAKAAQIDELAPQLEYSGYRSVFQAAMAAMSAQQLSDELISGVCSRYGLAGVPAAQQVRAVREVLKCAGIPLPGASAP